MLIWLFGHLLHIFKISLAMYIKILGHGPKSVGCQVVANLVGQLSFDKIGKIMYYFNYFHVLPAS